MIEEVWKDILNYEGYYQVSSYGRVKSLARIVHQKNGDRNRCDRILKDKKTVNGYLKACFYRNNKSR